jgi:hypothetical protein
LAKLVGLTTKDIYLFVEGDVRMLESTDWRNTLSLNGTAPLKAVQIEDQEVVEPGFAVTTTEDIHLVFDDAGGMELPHRGFSSNNTRDIETQLVNALLEIYENDI